MPSGALLPFGFAFTTWLMDVSAQMGFAKRLASSNKKLREKAISLLSLWLVSQKQIGEKDLKKIWKGLFYCVWHSDKMPVQADLIERLTGLSEKLNIELAMQLFKVFLITMRREWAGIDRLRMDKFYLLLRKYLFHMFVALKNIGWDKEVTKDFMDALLKRIFLAKDHFAALGISLHYADVFLQELEKFLPLSPEIGRLLVDPFLVVYTNSFDQALVERIRDCVFGRLLCVGCSFIAAKQEQTLLESKEMALGQFTLDLPLASEAFKLGSMPSTPQSSWKRLYELQEKFEFLERSLSRVGACMSLIDVVEVPQALEEGTLTLDSKRRKTVNKQALSESNTRLCPGEAENANNGGDRMGIFPLTCPSKKKKPKTEHDEQVEYKQINQPSEAEDALSQNSWRQGVKKKSLEEGGGLSVTGLDEVTTRSDVIEFTLHSTAKEQVTKKKKRKKKKAVSHSGTVINKNSPKGGLLGTSHDTNSLKLDDPVISNLEHQFDLLAAEGSTRPCMASLSSSGNIVTQSVTSKKKRKRLAPLLTSEDGGVPENAEEISDKTRRVRFALKRNLVWKPFSPLPPQVLRLPPSLTPRGSALKKGVPPGPIISDAEIISLKNHRKGMTEWPFLQSNIMSIQKGFPLYRKLIGSV